MQSVDVKAAMSKHQVGLVHCQISGHSPLTCCGLWVSKPFWAMITAPGHNCRIPEAPT